MLLHYYYKRQHWDRESPPNPESAFRLLLYLLDAYMDARLWVIHVIYLTICW